MEGGNQGNSFSPLTVSDPLISAAVTLTGTEPQTPNLTSADIDNENSLASIRAATPIVAIVFATATLYLGRDVLMPVAMALILAVIFTPIRTCWTVLSQDFAARRCP